MLVSIDDLLHFIIVNGLDKDKILEITGASNRSVNRWLQEGIPQKKFDMLVEYTKHE